MNISAIAVTIAAIGLALSLITSIVAVTTAVVSMKHNVTSIQKQDARRDESEERIVKELGDLLALVKAFIAEQTVINKTVATTLEGVVKKLESTGEQTIETASIVSLLTEALRAKGAILPASRERKRKR